MKRKINYNRPAVFYQDGYGILNSILTGPRIRIFYPNGHYEFGTLSGDPDYYKYFFKEQPCFLKYFIGISGRSPKNMREILKYVEKSDKRNGFPPQIFIGNL